MTLSKIDGLEVESKTLEEIGIFAALFLCLSVNLLLCLSLSFSVRV